jgi:hypothetical protein
MPVRSDCGLLRIYRLPWPRELPLPCEMTLLRILEQRAAVVAVLEESAN